MASHQQQQQPLYPQVDQSNPESLSSNPNPQSSSPSLYPSLDMSDLVANLFPDEDTADDPKNPTEVVEETLLSIPGAILHLIDKHRSVELAAGDLSLLRLRQADHVLAVLARVGSEVQWPLTRDEAAVKLDDSHYFFALRVPGEDVTDAGLLNYGLTLVAKGREASLKALDEILQSYSSFSVQKVNAAAKGEAEVLDSAVAMAATLAEVTWEGAKRRMMEERSAAYWTTLAPNVEDYSGLVAKAIVLGSGQLVKGILWCGDVTVERLKWGDDLLKKRMGPKAQDAEISEEALNRIKRVKKVTKMSEKVACGILTGVVKVSGFFTSSVVNSKAGKKFFSLLPGEIVLASLDGFGKICDAVEVAGKNVLSTSSVVTTGLVSHRYGEQAAEITNEGLDAAGHALGTAWTVFKIRKALDPKSTVKPTTFAKSAVKAAAAELRAKQGK